MAPRTDVVVIGGGHNGLVAAAYLAKAGRKVTLLEAADEVGGILRTTSPAEGVTRAGHRAHRGAPARLGRQGPPARAARLRGDRRQPSRMFAPQPDGSAVTFWGDPARTASELRDRNAHDAEAFVGFDAKMRSIASFLAYVNVATPPDAKSPSLADAIMGLKLGKAFRDLGAQGRARGDPRAADGRRRPRAGGLRRRGGARPAHDARRAVHGDGPVGDGHRGGVPERLGRHRRGSGRHRGVRPRRHRSARERARGGRAEPRRRRPHRRRGRRDPFAGTGASGASRSPTAPSSTRRSSSRPPIRSARCVCATRWS